MKTIQQIAIAIALLLAVQVGAQNIGEQAPSFTLDQLDGGSFSLADQTGKVVFIFMFGNSCADCIANVTNTELDIYDTYKNDSNFVAVGIDVWDGSTAQVESFQTTTGVSYTLLLDGSSLVSDYNITCDRIIVVGQAGDIKYKGTSNASPQVVADASDLIADLLGIADHEAKEVKLEAVFLQSQNMLEVNNPFILEKKVAYRVMDLSGRVLEQSHLQIAEHNRIPLEEPSNGVNFISLSDGQSTYVARFVR